LSNLVGQKSQWQRRSLCPFVQQFLEAALQAQLEQHLSADESEPSSNRKNGKVSKTVKTSDGELELVTSRDRNGSFEPEIIKKRETILADSLQDRIIGSGYPLKSCSSAELFSVLPDYVKVDRNTNSDTV